MLSFFQYKATDFVVPGNGKLIVQWQPDDASQQPIQHEAFDFKNGGGVAMTMYNTDQVRFVSEQ